MFRGIQKKVIVIKIIPVNLIEQFVIKGIETKESDPTGRGFTNDDSFIVYGQEI